MNDAEREAWVTGTDEGWYRRWLAWKRVNKGGMRAFLKAHRAEIDAFVEKKLGRKW